MQSLSSCASPSACPRWPPFDLQAKVDRLLAASDASEQGGGVCYENELKEACAPAVIAHLGSGHGRAGGLVGLMDFFGGIMAFERPGIDLALRAASEVHRPAILVAAHRRPDCVHSGDVDLVDRAKARELLAKAPRSKVIFVAGASPCQGERRGAPVGAMSETSLLATFVG